MHDAMIVRVLERRRNLFEETAGLLQVKTLPLEQIVAQRAAFDVGHHQIVPWSLFAKVVQGQNMVMRKRPRRFRFTFEAAHKGFIAAIEDLHGYASAYTAVVSQVDLCHSSTGDTATQLISSQRRAFYSWHRVSLLHSALATGQVTPTSLRSPTPARAACLAWRPVPFEMDRLHRAYVMCIALHRAPEGLPVGKIDGDLRCVDLGSSGAYLDHLRHLDKCGLEGNAHLLFTGIERACLQDIGKVFVEIDLRAALDETVGGGADDLVVNVATDAQWCVPRGVRQAILQREKILRKLPVYFEVGGIDIAPDQPVLLRIVSGRAAVDSVQIVEPEVVNFEAVAGGGVFLPSLFNDVAGSLCEVGSHLAVHPRRQWTERQVRGRHATKNGNDQWA